MQVKCYTKGIKSSLSSPRNSCPGEPHIGCCVEGVPSGTSVIEALDHLDPYDEFSSSSSSSLFSDITNDQSLIPLATGGNILGMESSSLPSSFFSAGLQMPDDETSAELFFGGDEGFSVPDYTAFLQDGSWGGTQEGGLGEFALSDEIDVGLGNDQLFSGQIAALGDQEMLFQG